MATYYCGAGGDTGNAGTSWGARKESLSQVEALALAAGDVVYVGPGMYRETLTTSHNGGSVYSTGTISATQNSAVITGSGTTFTGNVFANGQFQVSVLAHGTDGVSNGTTTFTSATGNFQAGHVGMTIRISTKAAYTIVAVGSATSITLSGSPTTATGLTYDVGPERPIEILSVDSNTQITLKENWTMPSFTGLGYTTWQDIRYIADVTGVNTDGVGGLVRITGSDNDKTATRTEVINCTNNYRTFIGFQLDTSSANGLLSTGHHLIADQCFIVGTVSGVGVSGTGNASSTTRRCIILSCSTQGILLTNGSTLDNSANLIENCLLISNSVGVMVTRVGGSLVRNIIAVSNISQGTRTNIAVSAGQATTINNSLFLNHATAIQGTATTDMIENYNNLYGNGTDRTNTNTGANSQTYTPLLAAPTLLAGYNLPAPFFFGTLNELSPLRQITGLFPAAQDIFGLIRPTTAGKISWGAAQFNDVSISTTQAHAGTHSLKLADAGRQQYIIPVTNMSITLACYVYRETNYAGTAPQMIIHQSGQNDITVTDAGSATAWNQLTNTFTPAATPSYIRVEFVSNNTATSGSYNTYFDDITVT